MDASASKKGIRGIDFRPRNFDLVVLLSLPAYLALILYTHLPISFVFLRAFFTNAGYLVVLTYVIASVLVAGKAIWAYRNDPTVFQDKERRNLLFAPYFTIDFLFITIRRTIAIFTIIFLFLHLKHLILFLRTANFDELFWNLDKQMHGGIQPNIWAMDFIGSNYTAQVILDWLYIKYFDYKLLVSLFFLLEIPKRKLSDSYFTAYALLWSLGGLAYLIMPADGPCFAVLSPYSVGIEKEERRHIFPSPMTLDVPKRYTELYVDAKIPTAKFYQWRLWSDRMNFLEGKNYPTVFYGIAAMPSLHVAAVTMIAVFIWAVSPIAGIFSVAFALITFFGSIYLQWHYAIDGYFGFFLGFFIAIAAIKTPLIIGRHRDENYTSFLDTIRLLKEKHKAA